MSSNEIVDTKDILTFPYLECACGCGKIINTVDSRGRPKKYINGHNRRIPRLNAISVEVDKIRELDQAKYIIKNQAKIIIDLQDLNEQQNSIIARLTQQHLKENSMSTEERYRYEVIRN